MTINQEGKLEKKFDVGKVLKRTALVGLILGTMTLSGCYGSHHGGYGYSRSYGFQQYSQRRPYESFQERERRGYYGIFEHKQRIHRLPKRPFGHHQRGPHSGFR